MKSSSIRRRDIATTAIIVLVIACCVVFVDRPVAEWSHRVFRPTKVFTYSAILLAQLDWLLGVMFGVLIATGVLRGRGRRSPWIDRLFNATLGGALGVVAALVLKYAIGRSQADPLFLEQGIYTVHVLSGSKDYSAFPSATMGASSGFLTAFVMDSKFEKSLGVLATLVLAFALISTDGHWLSDVIGGVVVGSLVGRLPVARGVAQPYTR